MSAGYAAVHQPLNNAQGSASGDSETISQLLTMYSNAMTANRQLVEMLEKSRAEVAALRRTRGLPFGPSMPAHPHHPGMQSMLGTFGLPGGVATGAPYNTPTVPFAGVATVASADSAARMNS